MKIVIGTRGSRLALVQANTVASMLRDAGALVNVETIETSGDVHGVLPREGGGKGLFVKEIDEALLSGQINIAVHSMKDVPGLLPDGITIAAVPAREDPRDVFISTKFRSISKLPQGASVGTLSPRRRVQLLNSRPYLRIVPMRGNVDTRIRKLKMGEVDAILLASAGLKRLGLFAEATEILSIKEMIPAVCQGALAIEARTKDRMLCEFVRKACHDELSGIAAEAERSFLKASGGDCRSPVAAYAEIASHQISITGLIATDDGSSTSTGTISGEIELAPSLGKRLAEKLRAEIS